MLSLAVRALRCALPAGLVLCVAAPAASADVTLLPVTGTMLTRAGATATVNGTALVATCRAAPTNPCRALTQPIDACRNLPAQPADPCRLLTTVLGALATIQPGQACIPSDPCRVVTALAATVTNGATRCTAFGAQSNVGTTGPVVVSATNPVLVNPFQPIDPCRALDPVALTYRLAVGADGTITTATATVGTGSVDLPPGPTEGPPPVLG